MWWDVSPLQSVYGHAKKGIIYAWILHHWIVNRWIVYCELAQPLSNDIHIHLTLEKEIGKIAILKKHKKHCSILKIVI